MSPTSVPPTSKTLEDPPNKTPKTMNSPSPNKGKSKIQDESSISCCGICLSEAGKSIRGFIDSCDHYFCFVCIMEWAKVESRCPMCKRRFCAIRRPLKEGVFAAERIVNVPPRDQIVDDSHQEFDHRVVQIPYESVLRSMCSSLRQWHQSAIGCNTNDFLYKLDLN